MSDFFEVYNRLYSEGDRTGKRQRTDSQRNLQAESFTFRSTAFIAIGLFCAFGGWYANQTMEAVWGSMSIQAIGAAFYFTGRLLSEAKAPFSIDWLNIIGVAFMPVSMITGYLSILIFKQGWIAPYPSGTVHIFIFGIAFLLVLITSYLLLKKRIHVTV